MKKFSVIIAAVAMFCLSAHAQSVGDRRLLNHLGVGVSAGVLDGIGFEVSTPLTGFFAIRAGVSFLPSLSRTFNVDLTGIDDYNKYFIKDNADIKVKTGFTNWKFLVDIHPFKGMFRLTAGAYFGSDVFASAENAEDFLKDGYKGTSGVVEGDYKYMSDLQGNVKADIKVNKFKPYVGIGVGRAVPKGRLAFNFDFGVQFWGKPSLWTNTQDDLTGNSVYTKIEKDHVKDKDFKDGLDYASKVIVCPVISFRLTGRIL